MGKKERYINIIVKYKTFLQFEAKDKGKYLNQSDAGTHGVSAYSAHLEIVLVISLSHLPKIFSFLEHKQCSIEVLQT